jgi:fatty-acyl-CoA synthase
MQDVPLNISSILRHGGSVFGDSPIVTCTADGSRRASFADVAERATRLAGGLRALGVTGDRRVATFMWNNQEHLEVYLAVPSMGAVLHTLNIRLFPDQIAFIAEHAQDEVIVLDCSLSALFAQVLPRLGSVHTVVVVGEGAEQAKAALAPAGKQVLTYDEVLAQGSTTFAWPEVEERSAAAMCYTSGTTGDPKGVVYSHRSMYLHSFAVCSGNVAGLTAGDRILPIVPMFHANAWGLPYAAFMAGSGLTMPDRFLQPEPLVRFMTAERPTVAGAVPTIWNDLLHWLHANPGHEGSVSSLRKVLCGGSAVPRSLMEAFSRELGVEIYQAWGMTETSPVATMAFAPDGIPEEQKWDLRSTAGRVLCGVEARLVDDDGVVQPHDGKSVGEVQVRGPWVTASYYKGADPERFEGGWLRTGDVGVIDPKGYLTLTDRAKDVIKSGGEWISSVELETTLIAHPDIVEAAVVGVPDERWQERPLAAVVLREGVPPDAATAEALRAWLAERVVKWWLPERWTFVASVPRTGVGKYDKKVVRKDYADGRLSVVELSAPGS